MGNGGIDRRIRTPPHGSQATCLLRRCSVLSRYFVILKNDPFQSFPINYPSTIHSKITQAEGTKRIVNDESISTPDLYQNHNIPRVVSSHQQGQFAIELTVASSYPDSRILKDLILQDSGGRILGARNLLRETHNWVIYRPHKKCYQATTMIIFVASFKVPDIISNMSSSHDSVLKKIAQTSLTSSQIRQGPIVH